MFNLKYSLPAALLGALLCLQADAQGAKDSAKAQPKTSADSTDVRYFATLGDILGDLPVESFIKETRQGGKVTSAVIDACYSVSASSDRKDRFVVELKPDGDKLIGNGQTMESKAPVSVSLTRKQVKQAIAFDGKITVGGNASLVSSPDNTDIGEKEFQQTQVVDDDLVEAPKDFTQVSPQSIGIRVKREGFIDLVKSLRSENVQIALDSIATDCNALRTGQQVLRLIVDPMRAPALTAKLKAAPGVVATGWTSGTYDMERAVRFAASDWSSAGKFDKEKFAAALSSAVAKSMSGKPATSKWNETTGEVTFSVKRASQSVPALDLVETIEMTALVGPGKPGASERMIVWVGTPSSKTADESSGPHLQFADNAGNEEESTFSDDDSLIKALASELKGQRWDTDKAAWK
ncbi:MAG: hypothetical protein AB1342_04600 [Pseudomonadota bacterium]